MNRTEWEASNHPGPMLSWLRERGSERKFRLFLCAAVRRLAPSLLGFGLELLPLVRAAERVADGLPASYAPPAGAVWARGGLRDAVVRFLSGEGDEPAWDLATQLTASLPYLLTLGSVVPHPAADAVASAQLRVQAEILRDLFGEQFHAEHLWPARLARADEAERIARAIYEEQSFEDMPVLADALEDAGCVDAEVLEHCRGQGRHARGCWILDNLLGRT